MRGVFLDRGALDRGDIDISPLEALLAEWTFYEQTAAEEVAARIAPADVVITNKVVLNEKNLAAAKPLRLICVSATGTNNVDIAAAQARAITVCNARGYATPSVVQHVYTFMLALSRNLLAYQALVQRDAWQHSAHFCALDHPIMELTGKRLGIVGYGELGQAVARVGAALGMEILVAERAGATPRAGRVALRELLPQVDVLSLHCPLTAETRGLIGREELQLMQREALLINTARGGIVDEAALADALRRGELGGAGVDVLSEEPPRSGNVLLAHDIPNLIVTPHIAWASREARQRLVDQTADNVRAFLAGTPRNVVMPG